MTETPANQPHVSGNAVGEVIPTAGYRLLARLQKSGALTPVSLDLESDITDAQAIQLAQLFGSVRRRSSWWIGDLLIFAEGRMGEKFAQVAAVTGLSEGALMNIVTTCRRVVKSRRRDELPFSVHGAVAGLPPSEQRKWLAVAVREMLTERELRSRIRGEGGESEPGIRVPPADVDRLSRVARLVWSRAQSDGNGWWRVPDEAMAQLAAVLGEGE